MVRSGFIRWAGAMVAAGALAASCAAVAVSPAAQAEEGGTETAASQIAALGERTEANAPQVRTLEDGTRVQITPGSVQNGPYSRFRSSGLDTGYNIAVLDADNRGCDSCHKVRRARPERS